MLETAQINAITDIVEEAQANGHTIAKITDAYPDMTVEDGYTVMFELLRRWQANGRELQGYKAGLTSLAKMRQMNVDTPGFGVLMRDTCDPDGGFVPTQGLIHPRAEAEIAFVMKGALSGPTVTREQVLDATDYVAAAVEILDSRFEKFKFDLQSVIADNSSSARFVVGGRARRPRDIDVTALGVILEINGEPVAFASSGAVLGDPVEVVRNLVSFLHARGQSLPAGTVVLTGAVTEAIPIKAGDAICARFQELGTINVRVS